MRTIEVGGARLSVIGLGTWQFGAREWGYGSEYDTRVAPAIVRRALDLGITLIDTAEIYGFGRSERIVGRAIEGRRDEVFLATKLLPLVPLEPVVEWRALESAARAGVDHIDLYQVHWPNPLFAPGTPMRAMAKLQRIGLVRHVGVSNYSLDQWRQADDALGGPVLSNQVQFSLAVRRHGDVLVPWAAEHDRVVIAYSPLAQGLLSGRYSKERPPQGRARQGNALFLPDNLERARELLGVLDEVARAHYASSSQVALAWLIRRPNVVAIPGASSVAQLEANAAAADLELSDDEDQALTEASDRFEPRTGKAAIADLVKSRFRR
ncbi:MAG TPA: aldo/keto reductase [Acidimicrobiales bacterium]|nr:aldo/keto reductase [Acidimicrobiales bacterium]